MHLTNRAEIAELRRQEENLFALFCQSRDAYLTATSPEAETYWYDQMIHDFDCRQELSARLRDAKNRSVRIGVLARMGSAWVGAHWSGYNQRLCVNLIPFVTLWVALPGGREP